ncbi:MAG: hypothetical protein R3F30_02800 [Planctomycetota bacterium]
MNLDQWTTATTDQTFLHPVGALLIALMFMLVLCVRRHWILPVWACAACFISVGQQVSVGGLDFHVLRIFLVAAWMRLVLREGWRPMRWNSVDVLILSWYLLSTLTSILLYKNFRIVTYRAGLGFDILLSYFLARQLVRTPADLRPMVRTLAWVSIPVGLLFVVERLSGFNPFSLLGGVPPHTLVREGKLRASGPFPHPIIGGSFWAALLPLFWAYGQRWLRDRRLYYVAIGTCLVTVMATNSSTPMVGVMCTAFGFAVLPFRRLIKPVLLVVPLVLTVLHFSRSTPVWHLFARIDLSGGSTGYHRFRLIDNAINHWHEWVAIGTQDTSHWGWLMFDITNEYLKVGVGNGLLAMLVFIAMIVSAFRCLGFAYGSPLLGREDRILIWGLGVTLFVHVIAFLAVSYYGQLSFLWYMTLGFVASMREGATAPREDRLAEVPWTFPAVMARSRQ